MFVLMEKIMVQKLCRIVGFTSGDGVFGPGNEVRFRVTMMCLSKSNSHRGQPRGRFWRKSLPVLADFSLF